MNNNMNILEIDINKLIFPKYNPRKKLKPEDKEYQKIKKSIEEFGYTDLVIINKDNTIISGNQRTQVLMDMGYKKIKVVQIDIDKTKEKALNIALNKITGEWDYAMLGDLLLDLDSQNYDLEITGFDLDEIEGIMAPLGLEEEKEVIEDDFDCTPPEEPKAKYGDIYQLGNHYLMCGDSTKEEDVEKLMNGNKADMVFTDPPYNIAYSGIKDKRTIENDKMNDEDFVDFLEKSIMKCDIAYVCCSWQYEHLFKKAMTNIGMAPKAMIIWNKVNPAQHLDKYFKQHEIIFYYGKFGGEKTIRGDIWECKRQKNTVHPTMKPIELIAMAIEDNPNKKTIYDGFGGSGSTLIACEQLNRNCYMMELDPKYVDVIINRWETFTGKKAVKIEGEK